MPRPLVACALLSLSVALGAAQRPPVSWLDQPPTNWNRAGGQVPRAPVNGETRASIIKRCTLEPPRTTGAERAVEAAGWIPFWTFDQQLVREDVEIVGGMRAADGMCRPMTYNLFVFVSGRFAGVLSPIPMNSRADSSLGAVRMPLPVLTADFVRFAETDALCCPSAHVTVRYRIDRTGVGPVVAPSEINPTRR